MNHELLNTGGDYHAEPEKAPIYWMHEAKNYLGLDRLGLVKPEQAIYRMVRKGIPKPRKIAGLLAFSKVELVPYSRKWGEEANKRTPKKNG